MNDAYLRLRQLIITCALEPGENVSEAELAERLQMSKTPVREALLRLRSEGFVETFPRRGYRVLPITLADMNQLLDARVVLEGGAAAFAAGAITDDELDTLDLLAEGTYRIEEVDSISGFIDANRRFHTAIAEASRKPRLVKMVSDNLAELERFFHVGAHARDIATETNADHHRIVQVLRGRDPDQARHIMVLHSEETRRGLLRAIAEGTPMKHVNIL